MASSNVTQYIGTVSSQEAIPVLPDPPTLRIIVPSGNEVPYRNRVAIIRFIWSAPVENFGDMASDIVITNATYSFADLTSNDDNTEFDLDITITDNTTGMVTVTVPINAADLDISEFQFQLQLTPNIQGNATIILDETISGPPESVSETFAFDTRNGTNDVPGTTTICSESFTFENNPYLNAVLEGSKRGGAFIGGTGMAKLNQFLYGVIQIQKKREVGNRLDPNAEAGAVLIAADVNNNACTILKTWEFVTEAAQKLVVHNGYVYFFEGSAWSSRSAEGMGHLYRINQSNMNHIEEVGLVWRSDEPTEADLFKGVHQKTISPLLSVGDKLNMIVGYGFLENLLNEVDDPEDADPSTLIDNWQWIEYSNVLNQRVDLLKTNKRTGYDVLRELALITNAVFGVKNNQFFFVPLQPYSAELEGSISQTGNVSSISYAKADDNFPNSGYLFIGSELFEYGGKTATAFTGVTRAVFNTSQSNHADESEITYVHHFLDIDSGIVEDPINDFKISTEPLFYNNLEVAYGDGKTHKDKNDMSITNYREKKLRLSVPLSEHQRRWVEHLTTIRLNRYSKQRQRVQMVLKSSFYFKLNEVVCVREPESGFFGVIQIIEITPNERGLTTTIIGVTI